MEVGGRFPSEGIGRISPFPPLGESLLGRRGVAGLLSAEEMGLHASKKEEETLEEVDLGVLAASSSSSSSIACVAASKGEEATEAGEEGCSELLLLLLWLVLLLCCGVYGQGLFVLSCKGREEESFSRELSGLLWIGERTVGDGWSPFVTEGAFAQE